MPGYKPPSKWAPGELAERAANLEAWETERRERAGITHFSPKLEIHDGYVEDCEECDTEGEP